MRKAMKPSLSRLLTALPLMALPVMALLSAASGSWAQTPTAKPASTDTTSTEWITEQYHRSFRLEALASYREAIKALAPLHAAYPSGYAINLRLGWLHYLAGNDSESEIYYRKAVGIAPGAAEPRIGLLLPLLAQAKWADAELESYRIIRDDPYNYYANLRLLIALRMQKKYELAIRQAEKLVRRYPADTLFLKELGLSLQADGQTDQARTVLQDVLTLSPPN